MLYNRLAGGYFTTTGRLAAAQLQVPEPRMHGPDTQQAACPQQ
jgi:hypothetical protein